MVADHYLGFSASELPDGVVKVVGEIDMVTAPLLEDALCASAATSDGNLVVDLSEVPFMDSAGMNVFVRVFKILNGQDRSLTLVNPCQGVRRALEIGGASTFAELR